MTTTIYPHLPFEDNDLDLIFAGSVFSHTDDLADAWLMEFCRILKPGGRAFITIQDESSIADLKEHRWWLSEQLYSTEAYPRYIEENFAMFAIGRHTEAQIFYNRQYFTSVASRIFKVVSVTPHAYGNQTGVLLEKRAQ